MSCQIFEVAFSKTVDLINLATLTGEALIIEAESKMSNMCDKGTTYPPAPYGTNALPLLQHSATVDYLPNAFLVRQSNTGVALWLCPRAFKESVLEA